VLGAAVGFGAIPSDPVADAIFDASLFGGAAHLRANRSRALLRVQEVGAFDIRAGAEVTVALDSGAHPLRVLANLYGTVAALVLGQQGRFAIHGSTLRLDGGGTTLAGAQRAGKSTTALELVRRGHELVADDVSPVDPAEDGSGVSVEGFGRSAHFWPETVEALGVPVPPGARPFPTTGKLVAPVVAAPGPVPLGSIVVIETRAGIEGVRSERVARRDAVPLLTLHSYRSNLTSRLWPDALFRWVALVAETTDVWRVARPVEGWTAPAVADDVERLAGPVR